MDQATHKRYLDYRDRFAYFGRKMTQLTMAEYEAAEKELSELEARGDEARDDEEEARYHELLKIMFKD
jgi:hypothetical protein